MKCFEFNSFENPLRFTNHLLINRCSVEHITQNLQRLVISLVSI